MLETRVGSGLEGVTPLVALQANISALYSVWAAWEPMEGVGDVCGGGGGDIWQVEGQVCCGFCIIWRSLSEYAAGGQ